MQNVEMADEIFTKGQFMVDRINALVRSQSFFPKMTCIAFQNKKMTCHPQIVCLPVAGSAAAFIILLSIQGLEPIRKPQHASQKLGDSPRVFIDRLHSHSDSPPAYNAAFLASSDAKLILVNQLLFELSLVNQHGNPLMDPRPPKGGSGSKETFTKAAIDVR
jgi:hypothetical protein